MRSISNVVDVTNYVMHVTAARCTPSTGTSSKAAASSCGVRARARSSGRSTASAARSTSATSSSPTAEGGRARGDHGRGGQRGHRCDDQCAARGRELRADRDPEDVRTARVAYRRLEPLGEGGRPAPGGTGRGPRQQAPRRPRRWRADRQRRRAFGPPRAPGRTSATRAHRSHRRARGHRRPSSAGSSSGWASVCRATGT